MSTPTPGIVERLLDYSGHNVSVTKAGVRSRKVLINPDGPEAAALLKNMAGLLKCIEWGDEDNPGCPFCGMGKESGHLDRCQLASALSTYHGDRT